MTTFIGEYNCKLDVKGRFLLPSAFKKNLSVEGQERFVVRRDIYETCLVLYPWNEWERMNNIIKKKINPYNKEHNKFLRAFFKGTAELVLDNANRLLIPKRLLDEVNIANEAVLAGQFGKIELWSPANYGSSMPSNDEFAGLANTILGGSMDDADL
jgi:MraZ protein